MSTTPPPGCTGPFSDAFDCPVHNPRKVTAAPAPACKLEFTVARLIATVSRCLGAGYGKYPLGMRDAIAELLPHVDVDHPIHNGLGEQVDTIASAWAKLQEKL